VLSKPEQDIAQLETLLRQLEKEYDQFLCGVLRREPAGTEGAVQGIVRTYANRPLSSNALNFKYSALVARYNAFKTVWARRLREREEGRAGGAAVSRPMVAAKLEPQQPGRTAADPAEYLTADPRHEQRRLEQFLETYRKARAECGESNDRLSAAAFQKALADKVDKIKREQQCDAVLLRVVSEQGRTRIVAKPFRRAAPGRGAGP
jgi:hypothetical protein